MTDKRRTLSILFLAAAALAGLGISAALSAEHFRLASGSLAPARFCGAGCESALASSDAYVAGVPAAALGLGWYAGLSVLCLCALLSPAGRGGWPDAPWTAALASLGVAGLPPAAWFTFKMFAASGRLEPAFRPAESYALCPYCLTLHGVTLLFCLSALGLHLLWGPRGAEEAEGASGETPESRPSNPVFRVALAAAAFAGLSAMIVPQWMDARERLRWHEETLESLKELPGARELVDAARLSGVTEEGMAKALEKLPPPSEGPADAKVVARVFGDLSCPRCLQTIQHLRDAAKEFPGQVRVEALFFPGHSDCNPAGAPSAHWRACDIARAGIAAYRLGGSFLFWKLFDDIRDHRLNVSADDPRAWARRLGVDENCFEAGMKEPETDIHLKRDVELGRKVPVEFWPTAVLNGRVLRPGLSAEGLAELVRAEVRERYPDLDAGATAAAAGHQHHG